MAAGAIVALAVVGSVASIAASGGDDKEVPITGTALDQASDAALAHTGGGRVTETEAGDEDGAYEVEVTRDDGSQVDVHLDADFNVIGDEADAADDEGAGDN